MSTDARAVVIRRKHVVRTDGDEAAVSDFHLAVKLDQPLRLALILRAVSSPAKHKNHGIWPLQIGKLATLARVIGQLIIGKYCASYNVSSHAIQPPLRQFDVSAFLSATHSGRETCRPPQHTPMLPICSLSALSSFGGASGSDIGYVQPSRPSSGHYVLFAP